MSINKKLFKASEKDRVLIITLGNQLRSDDGAGPYIGERIKALSPPYYLVNVFDRPENIMDEVEQIKPGKTIFIDAANFGGAPGEIRLLKEENIPSHTLSTHTFPISVISKLLRKDFDSKIVFIGIQCEDVSFGERMTDNVKKSADYLIKLINDL